jgi:hypothetical protein
MKGRAGIGTIEGSGTLMRRGDFDKFAWWTPDSSGPADCDPNLWVSCCAATRLLNVKKGRRYDERLIENHRVMEDRHVSRQQATASQAP